MEDKIYVVVIIDGASDRLRIEGKSPLEIANTPVLDRITTKSRTGLMQTLYEDLPKDSVVAQLGILGYDPYTYFPSGRSYFEIPNNVEVQENDLIFRVNMVFFDENSVLKSYNGFGINSEEASQIVSSINQGTSDLFPDFELHNISDFRNILIIKNAHSSNIEIRVAEPHESEDKIFDTTQLILCKSNDALTKRINDYINLANSIIDHENVNSIFPWGHSYAIELPLFSRRLKGAIVGHMDFLNGFSKFMGLDFTRVGNSNWNTDYERKGMEVMRKINEGYQFIYCHINGPDEASHMNDLHKKIFSIEQIDRHILAPLCSFFEKYPEKLGALSVCPDHYTNIKLDNSGTRREAHSTDAVPFLVWDNNGMDKVTKFSEDDVLEGVYSQSPISHLELLSIMGLETEDCPSFGSSIS